MPRNLTRREAIAGAATAIGAAAVAKVSAQEGPAASGPTVTVPADPTKLQGLPTSPLGARSPFVKPSRTPVGETVGSSLTPLQELTGPLTPSDLHFEQIGRAHV